MASLRSQGAHLLVGTPGRLDDIIQRCPFLDLKTVEVLVLDEADRLLDMGFKAQLDSLMGRLPRQRRTGLFSATQTEAVEALARAGLRNPIRVAVAVTAAAAAPAAEGGKRKKRKATEESDTEEEDDALNGGGGTAAAVVPGYQQITPSTLSVQYQIVDTADKLPYLAAFLAAHPNEKIIVYFLTCACVDYFATALARLAPCKRLSLHPLHGRMKQAARETTLAAFAGAASGVLLATDVAARGLDIPDVHWVVQHDPPQDPAAFVHRCGRTARMGRSGSALAFITPAEIPYVDFLKLRKIPLVEIPEKDGIVLPAELQDVLSVLRRESESDRAVMEAGTKAFVSYIRAYKEHHCKYIFRLEDVPLGDLAASFALLRLPRMPELKKAARMLSNGELPGFTASEVDIDSIKFKDKTREKQRQAMLKQRAAEAEAEGGFKKKISSDRKKGPAANGKGAPVVVQPRLTAAKRRQLEARQELDELNDEYALLRKLKKGKISEREYDVAAGLSEDEGGGAAAGAGGKGAKGKKGGNSSTVTGTAVGNLSDDEGEEAGPGSNGALLLLPKVGARNLVSEAVAKKAKKKMRKKARSKALSSNVGE